MPHFAVRLAVLVAALAAVPARAEVLVAVPGIPGDAIIDGHANEIVAASLQFQGGQIVPRSGPKPCPKASSKTQLPALTITKTTDAASPKLLEAAARATVFPQVTVTVGGFTGGGFVDFDRYRLSNAFISSYAASSAGERPVETVSFSFTTLELTHFDGAGGSEVGTWTPCGGP
jgi:type VI secretion system secreted protein Hcp